MIALGQKETFRLVLSYYERAKSEIRRWDDVRAGSNLDKTNYDQVRAKYVAHEKAAHALVKRLRADAERDLGPVETELRQKMRAQRKLIDAASGGTIDAKSANAQNRVLSEQIAELSARADDLRAIISADSTAALGGLINIPLEEYVKRLQDDAGPARVPRGRPWTPMEKNIAAGVVMFALVIGTVVAIAAFRSIVSAEFNVPERDITANSIRFECRNTGNRAITFYVPWPNGQAKVPRGSSSPRSSFGVLLSIREPGSSSFRAVESAEGVFKYRGRTLEEGAPVEITPNTTAAVLLDLNALRELGIEGDALTIEFSRSGGGERIRKEVPLAQ